MACGAPYPVVMSMGSASSRLRQAAYTGLQDRNDRYYKVGCYVNQSSALEGCVNTKHHHELMQEVSCIKGAGDIDTKGYEKKEC